MPIPQAFYSAIIFAIRKSWWLLLFFVWELVKDSFASWANQKIKSENGVIMEYIAPIIKELAIAPLGWTLLAAILIFTGIFIHAYLKESKKWVSVSKQSSDTPNKQEKENHKDRTYISQCENYYTGKLDKRWSMEFPKECVYRIDLTPRGEGEIRFLFDAIGDADADSLLNQDGSKYSAQYHCLHVGDEPEKRKNEGRDYFSRIDIVGDSTITNVEVETYTIEK